MPVAPGPSGSPPHQSVTIRGASNPGTKRKTSRKSNRRSGRR